MSTKHLRILGPGGRQAGSKPALEKAWCKGLCGSPHPCRTAVSQDSLGTVTQNVSPQQPLVILPLCPATD